MQDMEDDERVTDVSTSVDCPLGEGRARERTRTLEREIDETRFFVKRVTRQRWRRRQRAIMVAAAAMTFGCGGCGGPEPDDVPEVEDAGDGGGAVHDGGDAGRRVDVRTLDDGGQVPDGSVIVGGLPTVYDVELVATAEVWPGVVATHRSVVTSEGEVVSTCEAGTARGSVNYPPPAWKGGDAFCVAHGSLPWDSHLDGGMFYFWSDLHRRDGGVVIYDNDGSPDDGTGGLLR